MENTGKYALYVLAIVAIVAVVSLILQSGSTSNAPLQDQLGQASIGYKQKTSCVGKPCYVYCKDSSWIGGAQGQVNGVCKGVQSGCSCDASCPFGASQDYSQSSGCNGND